MRNNVDWADSAVPVASSVNDSMSFSQAFAAARAEVGPGGAFEWHGQVYGTYYADEWNSMTSGERAEWGQHFNWDRYHSDYEAQHSHHHDHHHAHDYTHHDTADDDVAVVDYGSVSDGAGGQMDVAVVAVSGEVGYVVDVDQDGTADYIMQDVNNDGVIAQNEVTNVVDSDIAMQDLQDAHNDMLTDYMDDAGFYS